MTLSPAQTITSATGQRAAVVKAEVAPATAVGSCRVTRGAVYTVAATGFRGELGPTVVLVIVAPEALSGAPPVPEAELRRILTTLRPAP